MKEIIQNKKQKTFNFLLNFKSFLLYPNKNVGFENIYFDFYVPDYIKRGFLDFYNNVCKEYYFDESDMLRLFIDYYMISLLNDGGIDISKTDVFNSDENIYKRLDFMSKKDCKSCLKKWDNLDPVDLICAYYPSNSVFDVKKTKDDYKVKVFSKNGKREPKKLIEFNDKAYKSFYDFYKFSGFPKIRIDNYKLISIIKGAKDKNDLLNSISEFNNGLNIPFKIEFVDNNIIKNISKVFSR